MRSGRTRASNPCIETRVLLLCAVSDSLGDSPGDNPSDSPGDSPSDSPSDSPVLGDIGKGCDVEMGTSLEDSISLWDRGREQL